MDNNNLYKIMYISSATSPMSDEDLDQLLEKSRRKNAFFDITGYLIHHKGNIIQLLEGKQVSVEYIYQTICLDDRHKNIIQVCADTISERSFPSWQMGFRDISPKQIADIQTIHDLFADQMSEQQIDSFCLRARLFFETFLKSVNGNNDYRFMSEQMRRI